MHWNYSLLIRQHYNTCVNCTKRKNCSLIKKNVNPVNFLWNQYFKTDLGHKILCSINVLETNAVSFFETLLGSQKFYVFEEGLYYTRGFTMGFIGTPTPVVDLFFFFFLMSSDFILRK